VLGSTQRNGPDAARQLSSGFCRYAPGNYRMEKNMNQKKSIDSCIDLLRKMLEDSNNELSSEQQSKLKKGIRELKRLKRATKLTYLQVSKVVSEIAQAAFEILTNGLSE
jgi:predicted lipase